MKSAVRQLCSGLLVFALSDGAWAEPPKNIQFNDHIRPILAANCFACHGFDAKQRKADLRLDTPEGALAARDGLTPIKPGDLANSEVWTRITSDDAELIMPPPSSKKSLTAEQKDLIRRWIEQGASYQKHWALEAPVRPAVPEVRNESWPKNLVDRFVLSCLEREGLRPQPEADRPTLIRRAAFALTGLPPTTVEVDAYLKDTSPHAYENMVDRYLESTHFGEEMARHWLDVARYADTHGLHLDNEREMWVYRDWVVKAFNDNLPFDQFTIWQVAGDLLPDSTQDQLIATGFSRCNVTTGEGGSITDELLYRYAVDRTSTLVQTWLGLTGGCAQCHDHKYDPLTMKEFYSLYAFFNSAADPGMDGNTRDTVPFVKVPSPDQERTLQQLQADETAAGSQLDRALAGAEYVDPADAGITSPPRNVTDVLIDDDFPFGVKLRNTSRNKASWALDPAFGARSGRRVLELAFTAQYDVTVELNSTPLVVPSAGRLEAWVRLDPRHPPDAFAIQLDGVKQPRRVVWGNADGLRGEPKDFAMGPIPPAGEWVHLIAPFDKIDLQPGDVIRSLVFSEIGGRVWLDAVQVTGERDPATDPMSSFRAWWRALQGRDANGVPGELKEALRAGPEKETFPELREKLQRFYLTHVQRPSESPVAELRQIADLARLARLSHEDTIPGTFIFRDLDKPREAFVMLRGQYDKPGDKVEPNVPAVFPALKKAAPDGRATRLDLARWLVAPEHPLTARVTVNRFWQQLFGTGLVKTSFDFGAQGETPSHPELLDWLALEFAAPTLAPPPLTKGGQGGSRPSNTNPAKAPAASASASDRSETRNATPPSPPFVRGGEAISKGGGASQWDIKGLIRLLVTSATFRQQARTTAEVLKRDPENRLYARGPRFRLDAEQIRDNALFVSGLIDLKMGGRGALTYQPPNIWEPVGYSDSNTRYYMQDHGSALYRRSLYCFLKRTAPPPFMTNFDGPNREQYCTRRERSNTPLQALQLMNDVQQFEAARALAERALTEGGASDRDRIAFLYQTVLARPPESEETRLLSELLAGQRGLFQGDPAAARQAVHVGESAPREIAPAPETAAWTIVANLVLNLDETVTRN